MELPASSYTRSRRRSLRRAVTLEVDVMSELWEGALPLTATDLSLHGAWLESELPLSVGEDLRLAFEPPHWQGLPRFEVAATVARVSLLRRRRDSGRAGMGLRFAPLSEATVRCLAYALRGLPPPLPARRSPLRFDPHPAIMRVDDVSYLFCAEAPLLSAGRPIALSTAPREIVSAAASSANDAERAPTRSTMTAIFAQPRVQLRYAAS
ncbi:MAG TPA: PilZ domain-containing protein [Polyangiales bacterium]